jgi:ABC-type glycerol-3-phosphate transport system substrate-binding protein
MFVTILSIALVALMPGGTMPSRAPALPGGGPSGAPGLLSGGGPDIYGYGQSVWWGPVGFWANSGGGGFFNADRTGCGLDSPGSIAGLTFIRDLYASGAALTYGEDPEPGFKAVASATSPPDTLPPPTAKPIAKRSAARTPVNRSRNASQLSTPIPAPTTYGDQYSGAHAAH